METSSSMHGVASLECVDSYPSCCWVCIGQVASVHQSCLHLDSFPSLGTQASVFCELGRFSHPPKTSQLILLLMTNVSAEGCLLSAFRVESNHNTEICKSEYLSSCFQDFLSILHPAGGMLMGLSSTPLELQSFRVYHSE